MHVKVFHPQLVVPVNSVIELCQYLHFCFWILRASLYVSELSLWEETVIIPIHFPYGACLGDGSLWITLFHPSHLMVHMHDHLMTLVSAFLFLCYKFQMGHKGIDKVPVCCSRFRCTMDLHNGTVMFLIHSGLVQVIPCVLFACSFITTEQCGDICMELSIVKLSRVLTTGLQSVIIHVIRIAFFTSAVHFFYR